jgi:hypothetical protein
MSADLFYSLMEGECDFTAMSHGSIVYCEVLLAMQIKTLTEVLEQQELPGKLCNENGEEVDGSSIDTKSIVNNIEFIKPILDNVRKNIASRGMMSAVYVAHWKNATRKYGVLHGMI